MDKYLIELLDGKLANWQYAHNGEKLPSIIKVSSEDIDELYPLILEAHGKENDGSIPLHKLTFRTIKIQVDGSLHSGEFLFEE